MYFVCVLFFLDFFFGGGSVFVFGRRRSNTKHEGAKIGSGHLPGGFLNLLSNMGWPNIMVGVEKRLVEGQWGGMTNGGHGNFVRRGMTNGYHCLVKIS